MYEQLNTTAGLRDSQDESEVEEDEEEVAQSPCYEL